ncbi:MAG: hypothetical protein MMC33_010710 [Icmadophila ericetorum]|nr:hypothetical protein [Icmadophila ericetorum]
MDEDDGASIRSASPAATITSTGMKRKRAADPKFYAVRVGIQPGIYHSWKECLEQVKGFKNATFKSFPNLTDAERFIAGEEPTRFDAGVSSPPYKFYAVKSGRVPGIYTDWPAAQKQITGWQKPKQRCFSTRAEAQRFLDEVDDPSERGSQAEGEQGFGAMNPFAEIMACSKKENAAKRPKKTPGNGTNTGGSSKTLTLEPFEYNQEEYEPGTGPLPPSSEDGFDPNLMLNPRTGNVAYKTRQQKEVTKLQAVGPGPDSMLRIHTDGSALRNGAEGALAGIGVYFGPNDKRNLSEALPGPRQTNQRAELTAILRALDTVPRDRDVTIITDSRYAIDCVTNWYRNWKRNGWKTSAGKPVENKDLVESVLAKMDERSALNSQTLFEWIKGHANHPGNVAADKLAVDGARNAIVP